MSAKGSPAWYRRHDARADLGAEHERIRKFARQNDMFEPNSERVAFETFFRDSRRGKGATYLEIALRRLPDNPWEYAAESTQRHWHTWQMAVGAGRLLPKYDPYKLAADELAASATERA